MASSVDGAVPSVLFINRVYPPATGATGALLAELAADLVADGRQVGVLTGATPGEPSYTITDDGVHIYRVPSLRFQRSSHAWRALAYLSLYPMLLMRALRLTDYDVVVTKTDPPMQFVLGPIVKAWTGQPLIHWAQDLYPDIAEALGVIEDDGWLARVMRRLSTWALNRHDKVIAVGRRMKERLEERGLSPDHVVVSPNWPPDVVHPVPRERNAFRVKHGLNGEFVVMYSGNMGLAHTFTSILNAAEVLRDRSDVLFMFVGDGARKAMVEAETKRRKLPNVRFLPFQPADQLAESLSAGDVHLVTMRAGTEGCVVPSKLYGALAAGRPTLFIGSPQSEAARFVVEHDCGTVLNAPSGNDLATAILDWKRDANRRDRVRRQSASAVSGIRADALSTFEVTIRAAARCSASWKTPLVQWAGALEARE